MVLSAATIMKIEPDKYLRGRHQGKSGSWQPGIHREGFMALTQSPVNNRITLSLGNIRLSEMRPGDDVVFIVHMRAQTARWW